MLLGKVEVWFGLVSVSWGVVECQLVECQLEWLNVSCSWVRSCSLRLVQGLAREQEIPPFAAAATALGFGAWIVEVVSRSRVFMVGSLLSSSRAVCQTVTETRRVSK